MSDPLTVHAEALADLDRQIERARAMGRKVARLGWGGDDLDLRGLEGRRRILQRNGPVLCSQCPESRQHYVCAAHPMTTWPDEDWRDAAGLPEESADG